MSAHLWRSELLGELDELALAQGRMQFFKRGQGPTLVFCHGWLANANLWRNVVDLLAERYTCITLDLPFGSHRIAMADGADLTPAGCGELIAAALDALELTDVTLIGNDSGGAYSQIALAAGAHRVARLVLNSCETPYDAFPPPPFDGLPQIARDASTLRSVLEALRDREIRATPPAYGLLIKHPLDDVVSDSYVLPCLCDNEVLRDTSKVMSTAASEPVHSAALSLIAELRRPVLLAWSPEDRVFPIANARRYADALPDARLELIEDAFSFTPEDQPAALANALASFVAV